MSDTILKQRAALKENSLDAIIGCSPKNVAYGIGFMIPSLPNVPSRNAAVIVTEAKDALMVVDMEYGTASAYADISKVVSYQEFRQHPMDCLAAMLVEMGLAKAKVGLDMAFLPAADFARLQQNLPECCFVNCSPLLEQIRWIKTPGEIQRLRMAAQVADGIHNEIYAQVAPGDTELKLGGLIAGEFIKRGGDGISLLVVASGDRSGLPNGKPTNRVMNKGELLRVDILGTYSCYFSDIARTVSIGKPQDRWVDIWARIYDTQQQLLEMVRPGVHTDDIYQRFVACFEQHGFPIGSFVGHGVGVDMHEGPLVGIFGGAELQENMCICIEPFIFHGVEGFQLEEQLLVTANGYEKLNKLSRTDVLLEIAG